MSIYLTCDECNTDLTHQSEIYCDSCIEKLKDQASDLEGKNNDLQSRVDELESENDEADERVEELEADIRVLQEQLDEDKK